MTGYILDLAGLKPVNPQPYPFTNLQLDWLKALESGSFQQGQGMLCTGDNKYCCLGVLADLSGANKQMQPVRNAYRYSLPDEFGWSGGVGMLTYGIRRLAFLKSDLGEFTNPVKFPGLNYGPADIQPPDVVPSGHTSLASMNDVRMLPMGEGKWRAFTFKEIAQYIRHDPWNVFNQPEDLVRAAFNPPPVLEGSGQAYAEA